MAKKNRQNAPRDRKRGIQFPKPPCTPKPPGPPPPPQPPGPGCDTLPDSGQILKKLFKKGK
jgi:hypothetical protein